VSTEQRTALPEYRGDTLGTLADEINDLVLRVIELGGDKFARPGSGHTTECNDVADALVAIRHQLVTLARGPVQTDSGYGPDFDLLAQRWSVIETEHDRHHPDRDHCGGVGGCSMMFAANTLESEMIEALHEWRVKDS
jgi:hypothetical protein